MDNKLELQERTQAEPGWWEKKEPNGPLLPDMATTEDYLIDPVDAYTARYALSSGEWDDKIYTFEGQSREEALKLCRNPIPAMEEDRRMLYGEAWFGNAYYPFKDRHADTYMKPYQSREEIERLLLLADTQEQDCVDHKHRAALDARYGTEERFNKVVAAIKVMMEKLANPPEELWAGCREEFDGKSYKPKQSRIDKLEELLTAAVSRIEKLEEEVAFLKVNSKMLTSDELAVKNGSEGEVIQTASPTPESPDQV